MAPKKRAPKIVAVKGADLPGPATHGFRLLDTDGETLLFFHWHKDGKTIEEILAPDPDDTAKMITRQGERQATSYADVLKALPVRLEELGYKSEVDAVLGEVVGRFGAG